MWHPPVQRRRRARTLVAWIVDGLLNPYAQCAAITVVYLGLVLAAPTLFALRDDALSDRTHAQSFDPGYRVEASADSEAYGAAR